MTAPTVHHAIDPDAGLEFLVDDFHDGLPMRIQHRPLGADGWEMWSAPVELTEVREVAPNPATRMPEVTRP